MVECLNDAGSLRFAFAQYVLFVVVLVLVLLPLLLVVGENTTKCCRRCGCSSDNTRDARHVGAASNPRLDHIEVLLDVLS